MPLEGGEHLRVRVCGAVRESLNACQAVVVIGKDEESRGEMMSLGQEKAYLDQTYEWVFTLHNLPPTLTGKWP